jgi:hypothetical protein
MAHVFFGIIILLVLGFSGFSFYAMCKASDDESDRILGRGKYAKKDDTNG